MSMPMYPLKCFLLDRQARYHSDGERVYLIAGMPSPDNNSLKLHVIDWKKINPIDQ